ncbi:MAG: efflux RND transporter permease subunit [Campylobacterales bacterium]|nr:efflux RND transporter permease subunit [Campylobacterales bacterium]
MKEDINSNIKPKDIAGKLAKGFLRNPLTSVLAAFLILVGYIALSFMPREEDPQIAISGGAVIVALPGANASEVEKVIINPLERKLREISGIEHIYGMAMNDVGIVNVMYYIGQDREDSNLKLYDKVMQNLDVMPKGAMQPLIKPFDIDIDIPILTVAFYIKDNKKISEVDFYKKVRDIQHSVNAIESVSKTNLKGDRRAQYNIEVDIGKLAGYNLSLGQIMMAIESVAKSVPNVSATTPDGNLVVFGLKNVIESVDDVKDIAVAQYGGSLIYLRDVANIYEGIDIQNKKIAIITHRETKEEDFSSNTQQTTLSISKLAGTNAVTVAKEVRDYLNTQESSFDNAGIGYVVTRNYGVRADDAVNELMHHLIITIVIIAIMLIFALGWKESLIVTFTVPAILAVTLFIAYLGGQSINRITLFAFLLSLGLLVDAAIIVIENIHRHLHDHNSSHESMDALLIEATDEIGPPTNIATLAIILTMVPMAFVGGMMGSFMKPIPLNVPVALVASLFVAYIFTPYLSLKLLKREHHKKEAK